MADRIVGQPSNLTTVSAGTGGNIRVTYNPWELDWEWFNTIVVGNWLANTTTAVSVDITAKGGAEHLGYWFEINLAFPSANWNTGNRISPQRQAAILQYATMAAAGAACVMDDFLLMWYFNVANYRVWNDTININNLAVSAWGMLSRQQIVSISSGVWQPRGNLLAQALPVQMVNMKLACTYNASPVIRYNPTAGQAGAGMLCRRLWVEGTQGIVFLVANANTCYASNCMAVRCNDGYLTSAGLGSFYNCGALCCTRLGFTASNAPLRNCWGVECAADYNGAANAQYCLDTDNSLPVAAGNLRNQSMKSVNFFYDLTRPGDKAFDQDFRINYNSILGAAGIAVGAVPRDCDGRLRPDPPSIGPWEPYPVAYAPAAEIIRGASKRGVQT